jgi:hypothetical protein
LDTLVQRMGTKTDLEDFGLDKVTEFKNDSQGDKNWTSAHMLFSIFEVNEEGVRKRGEEERRWSKLLESCNK